MIEWTEVTGVERRFQFFVFTQLPVAASVAVLYAVGYALDVQIERPVMLATGLGIVALATAISLLVPWSRVPVVTRGGPPVLDLLGIAAISAALEGTLDTVSVIAAFPAMWLGIAFRLPGAIIGIAGTCLASLAPVLLRPGDASGVEWAAALVVPVVVGVVTGLATVTVTMAREARAAHDRAASESERTGAALRSFFDRRDAGLLYLDENGGVVLSNDAIDEFGRLARHGEGDIAGSRVYCSDQVTPLPADEQPLARILRGESFSDLLYWVGPRGGQRALLANAQPIERTDGAPAGSILVVQDVTEIVRTNREREDALATLAHELRTPLTSIVGYSELLMMDDLGAAAAARVEVIARNADDLLALSSSFLDELHPHVELQRERVALADVVGDASAVMATTPGFAERDVRVDVAAELSAIADRRSIVAVLINLLSNAVKFSDAGDRIAITGSQNDSCVSLVVHNTGSCVDPADLERIFDRFYRGVNAQRGAVPGTGLGLSVSRAIVDAHGGSLTAENADDGVSFTMCLPRY